jgi:2-polyprenyl-6-methoxyphenol hydroxylase-like FAD-dependent oxidoreductase
MTAVQHVGVVGAGLAGLAASLAAAAAGLRVEVFEAAPRLPSVAAHMEIVPNLLRDLVTLGVADACVQRGFPYQGTDVVDAQGRVQFQIPAVHAAGPRYPAALGMLYGDLADILHAQGVQQGVRFHWGAPVQDVEAGSGEGGLIRLVDGTHHRFDLVLLAAGADAVRLARPPFAMRRIDEALPQAWWYALAPRPRALDRATRVVGPGLDKVVLVPVGMRTAGVALLRSVPSGHSAAAATPVDGAAMRAALASHGGPVRAVAAHLRDDTPVVARPVRSSLIEGDWHQGAVLCIGSCAHATPPHFGQAAAQAFEDAVVIGELLRTPADRDAVLRAFSARRSERARLVQAVTTQAAHWDLRPEPATDLRALLLRLQPIFSQPA